MALAELHKRMVRSPPPVMWMNNRNSEPSFGTMAHSDEDCIFKFPPVSTNGIPNRFGSMQHYRSQPQSSTSVPTGSKFLSPFEFNTGSRVRDSALEGVAGRFNLSPHLRRRPQQGFSYNN